MIYERQTEAMELGDNMVSQDYNTHPDNTMGIEKSVSQAIQTWKSPFSLIARFFDITEGCECNCLVLPFRKKTHSFQLWLNL